MSLPLPTGIGRIDQISLYSTDLKRSERFYRDGLGLERVLLRQPHVLFLSCGDMTLMLEKVDGTLDERRHVPEIYFRVTDIRKTHKALVSRGVVFRSDPTTIATVNGQEIWLAGFQDPDGQPLQLICNVPAAQT